MVVLREVSDVVPGAAPFVVIPMKPIHTEFGVSKVGWVPVQAVGMKNARVIINYQRGCFLESGSHDGEWYIDGLARLH